MIEHCPFATLAETEEHWFKGKLHFSFAGLPGYRSLSGLRVWNDDEFAPFSGFPLHFHRNVETMTYVREGAIYDEGCRRCNR